MYKEVEKLLQIAEAEVGYVEKASNSQLDSKTANPGSNNYTKYARDLDAIPGFYNGKKNGYAWCDVFVDWLFVQAFGVDRAKALLNHGTCGAGCYFSAQYFKNIKRFFTSAPQAGDQIFFKDASGSMCHTGIVYKVDSSKVYTIEGNTSSAAGVVANGGCVARKEYVIGYSRIAGYGRPAYKQEEKAPSKSVEDIAREVIKGLWGTGADRKRRLEEAGYNYSTVQAKVNELCGVKPTPVPTPAPAPAKKEDFEVKTWKNGSTPEPVYADSACKTKVGTIYARTQCPCYGIVDGKYIVSYPVDGTNYHKVGFVKYAGGIK